MVGLFNCRHADGSCSRTGLESASVQSILNKAIDFDQVKAFLTLVRLGFPRQPPLAQKAKAVPGLKLPRRSGRGRSVGIIMAEEKSSAFFVLNS